MPLRARGVSIDLSVPPVDGVANLLVKDVVGNREDGADTNTIQGRAEDAWQQAHTGQMVYPILATGVLVTAHTNAWTLGAYATLVPVNAIDCDFHIHHICICSASANGGYELRFYRGTERLAIVTFTRTDKKDDVAGLDITMRHLLANSQVRIKLASSNAAQEDTVRVKVWYHPHS